MLTRLVIVVNKDTSIDYNIRSKNLIDLPSSIFIHGGFKCRCLDFFDG